MDKEYKIVDNLETLQETIARVKEAQAKFAKFRKKK